MELLCLVLTNKTVKFLVAMKKVTADFGAMKEENAALY
jgi:hypothetical protein